MLKKPFEPLLIKVGARSSKLSRCQVKEVQTGLQGVVLEPIFVKTVGDRDRTISLRTLDKTDFFTREIDQMLLKGECRIAIHSAKDLPEPLPNGLEQVALTKGVDPSDSLVLREGELLSRGSVIATSSLRREERVRELLAHVSHDLCGNSHILLPHCVQRFGEKYRLEDVKFVDIRGTIEERIAKIDNGEVDGVVIAEAALIRLGLTHLNRVKLPGDTAPLQGQLAILACEGDLEMRALFSSQANVL